MVPLVAFGCLHFIGVTVPILKLFCRHAVALCKSLLLSSTFDKFSSILYDRCGANAWWSPGSIGRYIYDVCRLCHCVCLLRHRISSYSTGGLPQWDWGKRIDKLKMRNWGISFSRNCAFGVKYLPILRGNIGGYFCLFLTTNYKQNVNKNQIFDVKFDDIPGRFCI